MKRLALFLLVVVMVLSSVACSAPEANGNSDLEDNNTGNDTEGNNTIGDNTDDNTIVDPEPEGETKTVKLYFANQEYILTGDESLDAIISVERQVKIKDRPIEEVILEELQNEPEEEELTTIVEKVEVLSAEIAENTAYVNLSGENLHGGSLEESLILQQIVFSLTELEDVDRVQFLVDGSKRDSLMGHISIEEPLERPDI